MKHQLRILGLGAVLFMIVFALVSQPMAPVSAQKDDGLKELYDNDELFEQLSGAAQSLLELRFGKKTEKKGAKVFSGGDALIGPSAIGEDAPIGPFAALPTPLVNNPAADPGAQKTQSESTIAFAGGMNLVASYNDSGSFLGGAEKFTGYSTSTDMGATWTDRGALPTNANGDAGDPVLARHDATGRIYLSTLQFNGAGLRVFPSTDNGVTFGAPTQGAPGLVAASTFADKEWITVDNFAGAGNGNVYLGWRNFAGAGDFQGMLLTRSTDNGLTFGPNGGTQIAAGGQGAFVVVGPDHAVYYFWYNSSAAPRRITLRKSTDQGVTFGPTITVTNLIGTGTNGDLGLGGFRSSSFPQAVVNPVNGNVYVTYPDVSQAAPGGDRGNIFFRQSTDGGATWGAAVQLNTDGSATAHQFMPTIAVTPNGAALHVNWYDRRRDPGNVRIERWGVNATISGGTVTFGPNYRIGPQFPPVFGQDPVVNSVYMSDYETTVADNSFFYHTFLDATVATGQDVRFAKIPLGGPGPILDFVGTTISGGNGNGVIDFNECNNLTVKVMNNGSTTATGLTGTLTTTTPNVTIVAGTQPYPDIPAGGMASNATPFQISTSPTFVCGTTISLTLTFNTGDVVNFVLPSGSVGAATRFDNNTPTPIPDVTTTNVPINVAGFTGVIGDVNVSFHLVHTFDADLDIFLIAPDNTIVELSTDNGGSGDNFGTSCADASRTTFDDAAATAITAGTAPFVGTFRPEGMLAALNGKSGAAVNGTWTLRIIDDLGGDIGTLNCVSLFIAPTVCTDGGGVCGGAPCVITCPANVSASGTPGQCAVVTYPAPTTTGSCGPVVCTPPSGSCFPPGATTVTCTAGPGPSATCSFTVTVFDACLQDDSNPANVLVFNTTTGEYRFCCNGVTYTGTGKVSGLRGSITLSDASETRRLLAKLNVSQFRGTASLQSPPGTTLCTITDRDTRDNTCACQ